MDLRADPGRGGDVNVEKLGEPLDAKRVRQRQGRGGGQALSYLETHDVIRTANDIFGFGKWGHEIVELRPLSTVQVKSSGGKDGFHVGYVCIVKLTVTGCVPVSGVGYGDATEYTQTALVTAHELAAKEAESDALKRALKNYGDQFGLALYDKAAATSGHVATKPAVAAAASPAVDAHATAGDTTFKAPAARMPTRSQFERFSLLLNTYKKVNPEFDIDAAGNAIDGKDRDYVERAIKRLEGNIEQASVAA
jgi:DNA recombination protein Rad52